MNHLHWSWLVVSTGIDLACGAWWLLRAGPITLPRLGAALGLAAVTATLKLPVVLAVASPLFYAVHLGYWDVVLTTPVLAALVIASGRSSSGARLAATLLFAILPVAAWGSCIEPRRLVCEDVRVPVAAGRLSSELRVVVLADLQSRRIDDHLRAAIARTNEFDPHLVLLPGDLIQAPGRAAYAEAMPGFHELLAELDPPLGAWFVIGNSDTSAVARLEQIFEGTNVRLLENEVVELSHGPDTILVAGCGFEVASPEVRDFLTAVEQRPGDDLRLVLTHYPDAVFRLAPRTRVDLVVAGHTHGGQVVVPGFGPPIKLSGVSRRVAAGGLHELEGRRLYISRGVGLERGKAPPLRLFCPPEVTRMTFVPGP